MSRHVIVKHGAKDLIGILRKDKSKKTDCTLSWNPNYCLIPESSLLFTTFTLLQWCITGTHLDKDAWICMSHKPRMTMVAPSCLNWASPLSFRQQQHLCCSSKMSNLAKQVETMPSSRLYDGHVPPPLPPPLLSLCGLQSLQEQQRQWTIPDTLLQSNMKDAIAEDFLPSYKVSMSGWLACQAGSRTGLGVQGLYYSANCWVCLHDSAQHNAVGGKCIHCS